MSESITSVVWISVEHKTHLHKLPTSFEHLGIPSFLHLPLCHTPPGPSPPSAHLVGLLNHKLVLQSRNLVKPWGAQRGEPTDYLNCYIVYLWSSIEWLQQTAPRWGDEVCCNQTKEGEDGEKTIEIEIYPRRSCSRSIKLKVVHASFLLGFGMHRGPLRKRCWWTWCWLVHEHRSWYSWRRTYVK